MRNLNRLAVALAGALVAVAPRADAAWLSIGAPVQVAGGRPVAAPSSVGRPRTALLSVPRFSLKGQKYAARFGHRTEAGISWALDSRLSIQLNYERTAQAPMMRFDHDDGILTRLRVGF